MITNNLPPSLFFSEWRQLIEDSPLSPNFYGNTEQLQPAEEMLGVDSQAHAQKSANTNNDNDNWSAFNNLGTKISCKISLQLLAGGNNDVES